MPEPIEPLRDAIRNMHGCESVWVESVPVHETNNGETVWEGEVQVFDLPDRKETSRCYAWSHAVEGTERRRFFVTLHKPPIDSPSAAVKAAIVSEYRRQMLRPQPPERR